MRKYLWVVEQNYEKRRWYPLIDYIRRCREDARRLKKSLDNQAYVNRCNDVKYRVVRYERS